ncbi:MAG: histidine kinase dimerization/phosphoacceptor domain -containing protein [Devosia sp.]
MALSISLIAIILAIFAALCVQGFTTVLEQAKSKVQSAAEVAAKENHLLIGGARALLRHLADDAATLADGRGGLNRNTVASAIESLPEIVSFGLYDASGNPLDGMGSASLPSTISDLDLFKTLAAGKEWTLSRQLSDTATGASIFVVAQRVPGDSFRGIASLVISGDAMKEFWEPLKLGPASTTSILTEDGWLVARYPNVPETLDSSEAQAFTTLKNSASGTYISERSPADGVARVVGFRRLPDLGVVAVASISFDTVYGPLWTSIITVLWLIVPIALALLGGSLITARILNRSERMQANLAAAVDHNQVLFREIHHRVKNNLQSVASLLQMQPIPQAVKADMGRRLTAMSAVHEHIYRSNDFARVQIKGYLQTLIQNIRAGADPKVQVVEEIADVSVDKDAATPLGLILNEAVSNAFKHAFPDGREGTIAITLADEGNGRGLLTIADDGVGFDPDKPAKGIGQRLIRALTEQLGGQLDMTSTGGGSTFMLSFPLAK